MSEHLFLLMNANEAIYAFFKKPLVSPNGFILKYSPCHFTMSMLSHWLGPCLSGRSSPTALL